MHTPDAAVHANEGGSRPSLVARLGLLLCALVVVAACAGSRSIPTSVADRESKISHSAAGQSATSTTVPTTIPLSPLASLIVPAGTLPSIPDVRDLPAPVALSVGGAGIRAARIVPVGVARSGELEVPPADLVGWYRFGAHPGEAGTAVLAGHIAFDGLDGVFRRLSSAKAGDSVLVTYDDGSERRFVIARVDRYDKDELPSDLFARSGPTRLALITCGGAFNRELNSYEDNVVAIAEPA